MVKTVTPSRARPRRNADPVIIFCTMALVVFGLVMLASASSNLGASQFNDSYYYLKHQVYYGLSLGLIGFFLAGKVYYGLYRRMAVPLLLAAIGVLLLLFTPLAIQSGGAERWLRFGSITFQPSEVLKIPFIIYLAAWLGGGSERQRHLWRGFIPFLFFLGIILFLLLKQPATSAAALLLATALVVYFVSGARLTYILSALAAAAIVLALVVYLTPYRWERVKAFLNPESNLQTSGYHANQTKMAIGSGGWTGVGYGQSKSKIYFLPEPIGDSIFAVIAEELGFVGSGAVIGALFLLIMRMLVLAMKTRDRFAHLLLIGFAALITFQSFINIAAVAGLMPLTGMPLPFISYGGTALAVFMTMMGITVNVSKHV